MDKETPNCLTEEHLMLFGMITQWFARYELLIHKIIATVSGSDATSITLGREPVFRKDHALKC